MSEKIYNTTPKQRIKAVALALSDATGQRTIFQKKLQEMESSYKYHKEKLEHWESRINALDELLEILMEEIDTKKAEPEIPNA